MEEVLKFLKDSGVFYVATQDGDQPRVRPFGAFCEYNGKLYFCTNNTKDVYRQILANPKVEICSMTPDGKWLRLSGKLCRDTSREAKEHMLKAVPALQSMYSANDGIFEVLYLAGAKAVFCSMGGAPKTVEF